MQRLVVLGTGTEIGKTYVATAIARHFRAEGAAVVCLKPVETGVGGGETDAARLGEVSFHVKRPPREPLYAFEPAVSPHWASRQAGVVIDLERIARWVEAAELKVPKVPIINRAAGSIVETAGGVFSPLGDVLTNLDLARALEPARWVLVASDRLGVLHDVTATVRAMRGAARAPDAVVLSVPASADSSTGSNARELRRLGVHDRVFRVDRDAGPSADFATWLSSNARAIR